MYRILLADDEGIMLEAEKRIIESNFGTECEICCAKSGRMLIEQAETFRPDIAFIDIQMPGINGIDAMREITRTHKGIIFVIISAFDKFDYAKEAINLGVLEYLTKPVSKKVILDVLTRAMHRVDERRQKRSADLQIREKLETVIPIIENGFISSILLQEAAAEYSHYRELLDIREPYGYTLVLGFGDAIEGGKLTNPVGITVKAQAFYPKCREVIRDYWEKIIIGPMLSNRIVMVVPHKEKEMKYEERIQIIERCRTMLRKLEEHVEAKFCVGIGGNNKMEEMNYSYQEACRAFSEGKSRVSHYQDLPQNRMVEENYPAEVEQALFKAIERGEQEGCRRNANIFFQWMVENYGEYRDNIELKVLEFVMRAETEASLSGKREYGFLDRKDYMRMLREAADYGQMQAWFLKQLEEVCRQRQEENESQSNSVVKMAQNYIRQNFRRDISLEEVSRKVNISPYYFSKLFKEESSENFIDYLTRIRMQEAKRLLKDRSLTIKQVCAMCGYSDPNYFSRMFKKQEELTPSEYREKISV